MKKGFLFACALQIACVTAACGLPSQAAASSDVVPIEQARPASSPAVEAQARAVMEQMQKALPSAAPTSASSPAGTAPSADGAATRVSSPIIREVQTKGGARRTSVSVDDDGIRSNAPPIPSRLRFYAGQARVFRIPRPLRRVAIGNGEVLTALNVGRDELILIATAQGDTTLHIWMTDGAQREVDITVVGGNVETLSQTIRELLRDIKDITITPVGSNVIISGQNLTEAAMTRISVIQKAYPQVLNFASVDPVGMRPMVAMDVKVIEVDKNALDKLGIEWSPSINGPLGGAIADWKTNNHFRVLPKDDQMFNEIKDRLPLKIGTPATYFGLATTIMSKINILMSNGKAWMLAAPQLSARSGGKATFLAGGEVPIPMAGAFGQTTVEFKEYGIKLNIEPTVNDRMEIATTVLAEVSRIDPSVTVLGVPGFLTRRAESEINVNDGQTMVIAGLIGSEASKDVQKVPLLGDIPIIGKLFRSDGFRARRTELVILVTPRVVTPNSQQVLDGVQRAREIQEDLQKDANRRQKNYVN